MLMKFALLFIAFASGLIAGPCDGNPRINGNVTMTCQSTALDLSGGSLLQIHVQSANVNTVAVFIEIGWRSTTSAARESKTLRLTLFPFDQTTSFPLPAGASVTFVQVDEHVLASSTGFIQ